MPTISPLPGEPAVSQRFLCFKLISTFTLRFPSDQTARASRTGRDRVPSLSREQRGSTRREAAALEPACGHMAASAGRRGLHFPRGIAAGGGSLLPYWSASPPLCAGIGRRLRTLSGAVGGSVAYGGRGGSAALRLALRVPPCNAPPLPAASSRFTAPLSFAARPAPPSQRWGSGARPAEGAPGHEGRRGGRSQHLPAATGPRRPGIGGAPPR